MNLLLIQAIGFSVVASAVLFTAYAFFLHNVNKSPRALLTGALLLVGLSLLQLGHYDFIITGADPLDSINYRFWLSMPSSMFYLFSRSILFDETGFGISTWLHAAPVLLIFVPLIKRRVREGVAPWLLMALLDALGIFNNRHTPSGNFVAPWKPALTRLRFRS